MLRKLIKTDLKSTARIFFPLCASFFILALTLIFCSTILDTSTSNIAYAANMVAIILYILVSASFIAMAFIVPLLRFQSCILKNDAYLMLSIPIAPSFHIISKILCSLLWYLVAVFCRTIISFVMEIVTSDDFSSFSLMPTILDFFSDSFLPGRTKYAVLTRILYILDPILKFIFAELFIYMIIVLGALSKKSRGLLTAIYAVVGIVVLSWIYGVILAYGMANEMFYYILPCSSAFFLLFSIIFYIITAYILDKKYDLI